MMFSGTLLATVAPRWLAIDNTGGSSLADVVETKGTFPGVQSVFYLRCQFKRSEP